MLIGLLVYAILCSADPNTGNILNFNVGDNVDLRVPRVRNEEISVY